MSQYIQPQQDGSLRIYFPLKSYSHLRRTGWGLQNEQAVYVRVVFSAHRGTLWLTGFCIHLEGDEVPLARHSPCSMQQTEPPDRVICGRRPNRLVYQLSRIVLRYLRLPSPQSLDWAHFHNDITAELGELAQHCIVCHFEIETGNSLLRSTTCSRQCSLYFRRSQLAVRVPEMIVDPDAAGMLLWAVSSAIRCNKLNLVEGRPPQLTNSVMKGALSALDNFLDPKLDHNTSASTLSFVPPEVELFLSWVFTSYRGALISIPSPSGFSGDYRVFMANAKQELEIAFAEKLKPSGGNSGVVFHGTTFDRLYPILHNGLQTQVRRDMMQWGNVLGTGIYTTDDSEVAMGYAKDFAVPFPNREPIDLGGFVLLICELAEPMKHKKADRDPRSGKRCQIFVTTDPEDLILRAVVVALPGAELPHMQWRDAHRMIRIAR